VLITLLRYLLRYRHESHGGETVGPERDCELESRAAGPPTSRLNEEATCRNALGSGEKDNDAGKLGRFFIEMRLEAEQRIMMQVS
jgi:hypothetical protein